MLTLAILIALRFADPGPVVQINPIVPTLNGGTSLVPETPRPHVPGRDDEPTLTIGEAQ